MITTLAPLHPTPPSSCWDWGQQDTTFSCAGENQAVLISSFEIRGHSSRPGAVGSMFREEVGGTP